MYDLPNELLSEIAWDFTGTKYLNIDEFNNKVRQEQIEISQEDIWDPETIIHAPRIRIYYEVWEEVEGDDEVEKEVILESDNNQYFTKGELLFKLHNAVVDYIKELSHYFFEGLSLIETSEIANMPTYVMHLGS